jgi:hypothetical protein
MSPYLTSFSSWQLPAISPLFTLITILSLLVTCLALHRSARIWRQRAQSLEQQQANHLSIIFTQQQRLQQKAK